MLDILKLTRYSMGSQWNCWRSVCELDWKVFVRTSARTFCDFCNLAMFFFRVVPHKTVVIAPTQKRLNLLQASVIPTFASRLPPSRKPSGWWHRWYDTEMHFGRRSGGKRAVGGERGFVKQMSFKPTPFKLSHRSATTTANWAPAVAYQSRCEWHFHTTSYSSKRR